MCNKKKGMGALAILAAAMAFTAGMAHADPEVSYSNWLQSVKYSGDIRIRHEVFQKETPGQVDRKRERFRLRLNTDFALPSKFTVKLTLASGQGEQVSANQSFDNLSAQKPIWIDKAYIVWNPIDALKFQAGRMENPIWRQYSSDLVWDADYNPEAFSEGYAQLLGPVNVFATAMQMVVDEDSANNVGTATNGSQSDQWLMAEQIGAEFHLPVQSRLKLAYAYYDWQNIRNGTLSQNTTNEGNRRSGTGVLLSNFNVHEVSGQLSSWVGHWPIKLQGTLIHNTGVPDSLNPKEDRGYQWGAIVGEAKAKNTIEFAYFRKYAETDCTVADVSDSDFGDGGLNRKGNIYWVSYAPQEFLLLTIKYFDTNVVNTSISNDNRTPATGDDVVRRAQFDFTVKF